MRPDESDVPYLVGFVGLALVTVGAALVDAALGFMVPGAVCLLYAWSRLGRGGA